MSDIDLRKHVKSFLETGDYTMFGQGDEKALEPAIVNFCLEHEIDEIMVSSMSISDFSNQIIAEIQRIKFTDFVKELKQLVDSFGLDYRGSADEPDYNRLLINLSFGLDDEPQVDRLIRHVRNKLTNNFDNDSGKYPLAVWKSHVESAKCWDVEFGFSLTWECTEDIQP
ncbi:hypothetical protein [Vibrio sp. TRT 29B02]|uniref:hypothetical protein n=1 Tax=Vibrio sp. TRT 29B02 TaxID=3418508 RepID=UPI003CF5BC6A